MPDYFPLFNGANKRVFDATGAPVFARVRSGSIGVTMSATGAWTGSADGIPTGSVNGSLAVTFTRSSYGSFTPSATTGHWSSYLGKNSNDVDYWIILQLESLAFSYSGTEHKFVLAHAWRAWPSPDPNNTSGSILGTPTVNAYSRKSAEFYFPEGTYTPDWTVFTSSFGSRITLPGSLALTFTEA